jgi:hypothetical protein
MEMSKQQRSRRRNKNSEGSNTRGAATTYAASPMVVLAPLQQFFISVVQVVQ